MNTNQGRNKSKSEIKEDLEIAKLRKYSKLPPIKKGNLLCLRCENKFYSRDFANERMCDDCKIALNRWSEK